jgi:uncharacterized protein involved in exopolysaccharide biosynthesis
MKQKECNIMPDSEKISSAPHTVQLELKVTDSSLPIGAEIDLGQILRIIFQNSKLIISVTLFFIILSGIIAFSITPKFQSEVILAQATQSERGGIGSQKFEGLYNLVGINRGGGPEKTIAILRSRGFTERFINEQNILPILFSKKWDKKNKKWRKTKPSVFSRIFASKPARPSGNDGRPSMWEAYKKFNDIRKISVSPKTGLITLRIIWTDPEIAAAWANKLIDNLNDFIKGEAILQSQKKIKYLEDEASGTNNAELKQVIYNAIQTEITKVASASATETYALEVIDKAVPPEEKYSPRRLFYLISGMIGGLFVSIFYVLFRAFRKQGMAL